MFVAGVTARTGCELVRANRHSSTLFYQKIREMIALELEDKSPFSGEVEIDESYFGSHRQGNRGRGAGGKIPVFGILEHGGKVYTKVIPDASSSSLIPLIKHKVLPDSIVYTDRWRAYDVLDVSEFHHFRINHSQLFLLIEKTISMALRTSGTKQNATCASTMVFQNSIFTYS